MIESRFKELYQRGLGAEQVTLTNDIYFEILDELGRLRQSEQMIINIVNDPSPFEFDDDSDDEVHEDEVPF